LQEKLEKSGCKKMKNYSILVIGAGAGGLVVAIGATKAGKKVLLIEKGNYGGDCTNFGCIPSKSLIASAHSAACLKESQELGLEFSSKLIQAQGALERVRAIVGEVRSHEDPDALNKIGLDTLTGTAQFVEPHVLDVNGEKVYAKHIVIATGSTPFIPSINGLENTPFCTNETIFELKEVPKSLVVLGGGPIGSELAQAFLRLGSKVTLIHAHSELLNKEEPLAQEVIANQFKAEGMTLYLSANVQQVSYQNGQFHISLDNGQRIQSEALLVSVGRRPNVSSLHLEAAGVKYSDKGIAVDVYGRTSQRHIWAVGDVIGSPFFTHWAENQARNVLTSLLLPFPFKKKFAHKQSIPRVTYTDPEVASVGLSEKEARLRYTIATYTVPFIHVDRAITTGRTEGFVKIVTKKWSSKILGCTIVGERAGEMLGEISLAMHAGIPLRKISGLIHPYPTYNLAIRKAADLWLTQTILAAFKRKK
jgi:pyruvate/2-oxoglutarate dehydrogenase complex dihydrolipoamide dehydrogenase (E3) component